MKIVADENIPFVKDHFGKEAEYVLKPGREIQQADLIDADILLVRSVTAVNADLLDNTAVKFVGSATAGLDHLDLDYLKGNQIDWAAAVGSNARAVVEYVIAVLATFPSLPKKVAIIGVGNIGSVLAIVLEQLGSQVFLCDPLRAEKEKNFPHLAIDKMENMDFISIHTPLTSDGEHPTFHLIDKNFLAKQASGNILLNAGRGAVIHFQDLQSELTRLRFCLDVWENEPEIDPVILNAVNIASPHIAGYSVQSKVRGVQMIQKALVEKGFIPASLLDNSIHENQTLSFGNRECTWQEVVLSVFDPRKMTALMRAALQAEGPAAFDHLRKNFTERHEFAYSYLKHLKLKAWDESVLKILGFPI